MALSFSIKVAAEQCGLSERTIHNAIQDGRLMAFRVGRRVLIGQAELEEFLRGQKAKTEGCAGE
jgi:excisionase family DNA binding protein